MMGLLETADHPLKFSFNSIQCSNMCEVWLFYGCITLDFSLLINTTCGLAREVLDRY